MVGARVRPPAHPPPPPRLELPHHNDAIMTDYHEQMMEWTTQHEHSELARTPERGAFSEPSWELQHKQQPNAGFAAALPLASRMVALLSTVPSIMHSALSSPCSAISIDRGVPALPQLTMHPSVTARYASEEMRTRWILWMLEKNRAGECHWLEPVVQCAAT